MNLNIYKEKTRKQDFSQEIHNEVKTMKDFETTKGNSMFSNFN
jgi:hypothetical protein